MSPEKARKVMNLQQRSTLAGEAAAAATEVEAALSTPDDPTAAAFFDVDNTVMQGASIFHLARGLHRREFFTTREILAANGLSDDRFATAAGKADTDPMFPDNPYLAANRRVTITLLAEAPPVPADMKP